MADPASQALPLSAEILPGAPIPFRFEITWGSLTANLGPSGVKPAAPPPAKRAVSSAAEAKEWEMVLPRMKRPAPLPPPAPDSPLAVPNFSTVGTRRRWLVPAGAAALLAAAIGLVRWSGESSGASSETSRSTQDMGSAGWFSEWASDAIGSARGRQISLYRPSIKESDYRLEFLGRVELRSLGWVFRAVDSRNYYVGKLEAGQSGPFRFTITHFAVIKGSEGPHIQRTIPMTIAPDALLKVRVDVRGPRFTVYVHDQAVEDWEDDRLKTGGVGFLNERQERGAVSSVRISFPKGVR